MRQWAKLFPKNLNKIGAFIRDRFGLEVSKQTIKRVLKSFAVSWRRIRKQVKKRPNPETYPEKREALETLIEEDRAGIIDRRYFDESGFCFVPYIPYAWQEKGDTISIESMQSKRLNVLGLMTKRHELDAYTFEGTVDSAVVIGGFDQFCEAIQEPTVVVMDKASIHTSEACQEAIPQWEKQGLSIVYLPEYSPALNLIEILWRFMQYEWIEFWAYTSFAHLVQYVEEIIKKFGEKYKINFV